jgi:hypothetical protein
MAGWIHKWSGLALGALTLAVLLLSCGKDAGIPGKGEEQSHPEGAPQIHELMDRLNAELARLEKYPARTASIAPSGPDNAVFDLSAVLIDVSGNSLTPEDISAGAEVSGVRLDWTEQLVGDYDQNGEVNIGDLTPMAQYWQALVDYDDPALHGGFARWPSGDPEDDGWPTGTSAPPKDGSGASNWRRARVDGDANGEINLADITPIAAHWQESSDGYRVYRKAPGESGFTRLPNPGDAGSPLTLPHQVTTPALSPRYSLSDSVVAVPGVYEYYCAPYDETSGL